MPAPEEDPYPPILRALGAFECQLGHPDPKESRFVARRPWLFRAGWRLELLGQLLTRNVFAVPGLQPAHVLGLIAGNERSAHLPAYIRTHADAMQINGSHTRLRAFYLPRTGRSARSLKLVSCEAPNLISEMRQEIGIRRQVEDIGTICVPPLGEVIEGNDYLCMTEDMVLGRRYTLLLDVPLFIETGLPQLAATYRALGYRRERYSAFVPSDLDTKLRKIRGTGGLADAVARAQEADLEVSAGLCHGDLVPSNLAVSRDTLYFLDWGRSHDGLLAHDLCMLPFKDPRLTLPMIRAVRETLVRNLDTAPESADAQIALYAAQRIVAHPRDARRFLYFWRKATECPISVANRRELK